MRVRVGGWRLGVRGRGRRACRIIKLVSELVCSPYAAGVSVTRCSSMYSRYCACPSGGGASNDGKNCSDSSSSSRRKVFRYAEHSRRSLLSVMCPPYMISPKM